MPTLIEKFAGLLPEALKNIGNNQIKQELIEGLSNPPAPDISAVTFATKQTEEISQSAANTQPLQLKISAALDIAKINFHNKQSSTNSATEPQDPNTPSLISTQLKTFNGIFSADFTKKEGAEKINAMSDAVKKLDESAKKSFKDNFILDNTIKFIQNKLWEQTRTELQNTNSGNNPNIDRLAKTYRKNLNALAKDVKSSTLKKALLSDKNPLKHIDKQFEKKLEIAKELDNSVEVLKNECVELAKKYDEAMTAITGKDPIDQQQKAFLEEESKKLISAKDAIPVNPTKIAESNTAYENAEKQLAFHTARAALLTEATELQKEFDNSAKKMQAAKTAMEDDIKILDPTNPTENQKKINLDKSIEEIDELIKTLTGNIPTPDNIMKMQTSEAIKNAKKDLPQLPERTRFEEIKEIDTSKLTAIKQAYKNDPSINTVLDITENAITELNKAIQERNKIADKVVNKDGEKAYKIEYQAALTKVDEKMSAVSDQLHNSANRGLLEKAFNDDQKQNELYELTTALREADEATQHAMLKNKLKIHTTKFDEPYNQANKIDVLMRSMAQARTDDRKLIPTLGSESLEGTFDPTKDNAAKKECSISYTQYNKETNKMETITPKDKKGNALKLSYQEACAVVAKYNLDHKPKAKISGGPGGYEIDCGRRNATGRNAMIGLMTEWQNDRLDRTATAAAVTQTNPTTNTGGNSPQPPTTPTSAAATVQQADTTTSTNMPNTNQENDKNAEQAKTRTA